MALTAAALAEPPQAWTLRPVLQHPIRKQSFRTAHKVTFTKQIHCKFKRSKLIRARHFNGNRLLFVDVLVTLSPIEMAGSNQFRTFEFAVDLLREGDFVPCEMIACGSDAEAQDAASTPAVAQPVQRPLEPFGSI